jgi:WD40 repeat protein
VCGDGKYSVLDSMPVNIYSSDLSPDGKYIFCSPPKGDWIIVYANNKKIFKNSDIVYGRLEETFDKYYSYSWSPDGKYLIGNSCDGKFGLWNAKSGLFIQTFEKYNRDIKFVGFTSDGRKIISKGEDGEILQWDFPPLDELIEKTKKWAGK